MHERRALWQPIPRCVTCGRILSILPVDGVSPCERCLSVDGVLHADSPGVVTAAFHSSAQHIDELVDETRAEASIWDHRLRDRRLSARVVSSAARGQRGWSVLRVAPSFGAKVEQFALANSAIGTGVRVVLAGVAPLTRVYDVRTGRTLILEAA